MLSTALPSTCKDRTSVLCKGWPDATKAGGWGQLDVHQGLHQQTTYFFSSESVCSGSSTIVSVPSAKFKILYISQTLINTLPCKPQTMTHLTSLQLFETPAEWEGAGAHHGRSGWRLCFLPVSLTAARWCEGQQSRCSPGCLHGECSAVLPVLLAQQQLQVTQMESPQEDLCLKEGWGAGGSLEVSASCLWVLGFSVNGNLPTS